MEKKKVALLCTVVAVTACFVTGLFTSQYILSRQQGNDLRLEGGSYQDIEKYMEFGDLEQIINENYYTEVDEAALVDGALKGMIGSLDDPYSVYYTEEEYTEYTQAKEGKFVGIGVVVSPDEETGGLLILSVYKGGPAYEAGVVEGEVIVSIDGVNLTELDFDSSSELIQGPSGSSLTMGVLTPEGEAREYTMIRTEVQTPYVFYSMLDEDIAYITISAFHGDSAQEFADALEAIREEEGAKGVVIDLRGNMGGDVNDATAMLDLLLPEGVIFYSIDKNGDKKEWTSDASYDDIPLAVLVNGTSASASEIFAGAIQDYERGTLVGTQTYGKGVTQLVISMPYSGGGVKITNAVYYTPSGRNINGVGLTPDRIVELPDDLTQLTQDTDSQLQTAMQVVREKIS